MDNEPTGQHTHMNRSFTSEHSDRVRVYSGMKGRLSLTELRAFLDEHAAGVPDEGIMLNYATVVFEADATMEELVLRAERKAAGDKRRESWERWKLAELKAKYEGERTRNIFCPHCQWRLGEDDHETANMFGGVVSLECKSCGKELEIEVHAEVTYVTKVVDDDG